MFESTKSSNEGIKIIPEENFKKNRNENKRRSTNYSHKNKAKIEFPPKRNSTRKPTKATMIVKETEGVEFIPTKKDANKQKVKRRSFKLHSKAEKNKLIEQPAQNLKTSGEEIKEAKIKENEENEIKKKTQIKLDNFELNNLEYDQAWELDKRGFVRLIVQF